VDKLTLTLVTHGNGSRVSEQKVLEIKVYKYAKCHTQHHLYENSELRYMTEELRPARTIILHMSMHF